ncbi:MAG: thiopurine S-methyltransferase [Nitrospirae bacterium CG18_big_fil_WC_8_21_14_2_50_70_55]|nr:methyltransferase domain-containing protein [Deltaproteobacteria bacterium]OIP64748.1 MAG: thiopurine S-methyltransferase [Nitrospirae bacterium CG2_30_70_394]PIQ03141.1 MAG: thiopurine S-methyltransferase [Nitrospirae bacterium CG18_big_fil_WC_8_21_14_2_50_70_55]PIU78299.1 MAG: thiopurine S-methyltransferase [Nitrospirae bacterium CG06_land_8_20_14_3_00_70_43]PIW82334.1 MAG: thiopurine S-methyltransferase [Nitrospirae bacterium CG_4_8_14_3_um_filter_70_85]PIX83065.1 MAG: thiopurine S-methy
MASDYRAADNEWEARYRRGETGWDRGGVSPAVGHWQTTGYLRAGDRLLVPGCGRGHEVVALARAGLAVTGVDLAPSAVAATRAALTVAGVEATVVEADLLAWEPAAPFDAIYEQTCLCALAPADWPAYALRLARWLRPGGHLLAHFLQTGRAGGPPFDCVVAAMRTLFAAPTWRWSAREPWGIDHPNGLRELAYPLDRR